MYTKLALPTLLMIVLGFGSLEPDQPHSGTPELSDMEIAHIAYTASLIDIRYAHLALAVSDNPAVREFAETMIRDHSAVNEKAVSLLQDLNASPRDNATSQQLASEATSTRRELMALEGSAFDARYAANELNYHRFVNSAVEEQFIPSVQNDRFRDLLRSALKTFKVHEKHADRLALELNSNGM